MRGGVFFFVRAGSVPGCGHEYQMELSAVVVDVLSVSWVLSSSSLFMSLLVFRFIFQLLNTLSACQVYHVERVAS